MFNLQKYMLHAIEAGKEAERRSMVPVGSILVIRGEIISSSFNSEIISENGKVNENNKKNDEKDFLNFSREIFIPQNIMHAELIASIKAAAILKKNSLEEAFIFVTLEPCPMCAGMLSLLRVKKIIFGAYKNISEYHLDDHFFNFKPEVIGGVLENECINLMKTFFKKLRVENK